MIIIRIAILMIHLWQFIRFCNESFRNKTMNKPFGPNSILA